MIEFPLTCTRCQCDLTDESLLGIEVWGQYDGVSYWQCRNCKHTWCRFCDSVEGGEHLDSCTIAKWGTGRVTDRPVRRTYERR